MLELHSLTKRYGAVLALDDLSLTVQPGEIFGFLGPNGAGKSTTIRLLLGLISPTSGTATLLGQPVATGSQWRAEVGYLPGDVALWPRLTGRRTLAMLQAITGTPAVWRDELLERLQFSEADLDRRVRTYSDGMRQKIGIVQALQCSPQLALLDEPTKGLDPLIQLAFYGIVTDAAARGTTVFFSSHVLPEVERVCTRVAMLRRGRLITVGNVPDIRRLLPRRVTVVGREALDVGALSAFGRIIAQSDLRVELLVPTDDIPRFTARVGSMPIADLLIESQTLEDAFLEQYPMMRGTGVLLARLWRQHALMLALMCAGLAVFTFIVTRFAPAPDEVGLFQTIITMIPKPVLAMVGGELAMSSARGIVAFGYIHPFFLAIMAAWILRTTAGALAGEIGRGTMDLIASRPVARAGLVLSTWAMAIAGVALLAFSAWLGTAVGLQVRTLDVTARELAIVPAMGALMFMAWTSIGLLISAAQREAGPVIAWTGGLIAVSFVVVFISQIWSPAETIRPLSLFTYFQPQDIVVRGVAARDIVVLAAVTVVGLAAAIAVFHRRDL